MLGGVVEVGGAGMDAFFEVCNVLAMRPEAGAVVELA